MSIHEKLDDVTLSLDGQSSTFRQHPPDLGGILRDVPTAVPSAAWQLLCGT